jgi:hypothetical protein
MRLKSIVTFATIAVLAGCGHEPTAATRSGGKPRLTLSSTISGPTYVPNGVACTWTAYPTGGTAPYEYDWIGGNAFSATNQQSYTAEASSSNGTISIAIAVTVTDALGSSVTVQKRVTSLPGGSC